MQHQIGKIALVLMAIFLTLYCTVLYLHTHDSARLASLYTKPGLREFIGLVCRWSNKQPPVDASRQSTPQPPAEIGRAAQSEPVRPDELLVSETQHFAELVDFLCARVCGHDDTVARLVQLLERNLTLHRMSSEDARLSPLGVFVFAGPPGIGKRHLATLVGRAIYRSRTVMHLDMRDYSDDSAVLELFGSPQPQEAGRLVDAVIKQPFQSIILDNIERSAPPVLERLARVFREGHWCAGGKLAPVSFRHCVFFLVTSAGHEALERLRIPESTEVATSRIADLLARETPLPTGLLRVVQDYLLFQPLTMLNQARVIAGLMEKESLKYNLRLDYVDPAVLAEEVSAITPQDGLEAVPARVVRLMKKPLSKAIESHRRGVLVKHSTPPQERAPRHE